MIKNLVILFKSLNETQDKFERHLTEHNYNVKVVKTIDFVYKNLDEFKSKLEQTENYCGLIFSSPRCVYATKQAIGDLLNQEWRRKSNYAVGESTFHEANEKLKLECLGKESGNAKNLAEVIKKEKFRFNKPFLYPHGNLKMDILKGCLETTAVLEEICVYETIASPVVEKEIKDATSNFEIIPEFMVFFSPSGIKTVVEYIDKLYLEKIKIIAIGPTTEAALTDNDIKCYNTAVRPTPEDLLTAMEERR